MRAAVYVKLQFRAQISLLWNNVVSLPLHQEIPYIGEGSYFHLLLCVACLGSHVWEKRSVWKVKESWINRGLIGIHVQSNSTQLPRVVSNIEWLDRQKDSHARPLAL